MEDSRKEMMVKLTRKQEEQLRVLYDDVRQAAARHAREHGLELVLHYNDLTGDELDSGQNIARKLGDGACIPLYTAPGLDATTAILAALEKADGKRGD